MIGCCDTFQETNLLLNCRLSTFAAFFQNNPTCEMSHRLTKAFAQLLTFELSSDTKKKHLPNVIAQRIMPSDVAFDPQIASLTVGRYSIFMFCFHQKNTK